jgi:hypothetical protein
MADNQLTFWAGPGGALMCGKEIPSITQDLTREETAVWYGGRFFVGETLSKGAMKRIAEALGGVFLEGTNDGGSEGVGGDGARAVLRGVSATRWITWTVRRRRSMCFGGTVGRGSRTL